MDSFSNAGWLICLASGLAGYLIGSVSFARIITFILTRSSRFERFTLEMPGSDEPFETDLVSATAIGSQHGRLYGIVTSLLDIVKVAAPTYLVLHLYPDQPCYLVTALFGLVGHNYPVYYRFVGGRGDSPILGALLVINWFGILIANGAAMILGYLTGKVLVMRLGGHVLCIFWFWIYFNDIYHVGFMVLANVIFWASSTRDLDRFLGMIRKKNLVINEEFMSKAMLMGSGFGRFIDNYGFPALMRKIFRQKT